MNPYQEARRLQDAGFPPELLLRLEQLLEFGLADIGVGVRLKHPRASTAVALAVCQRNHALNLSGLSSKKGWGM